MKRILTAVFLFSCLILLRGDETKDSWPLFRSDAEQTGVARGRLPEKLQLKWKFKAQQGVEGTAALAGGMVFINSFDSHLYALDLKSGAQKWKAKLGPSKAPVAYREGLVYVGDEDGKMHCVDAATGAARWSYDAGAEVTSGVGFAGEDLLFGTAGEMLYCLSKDGKKKWEFKVAGGPVNATPAVSGGFTFVAGCDSALHVIDVKTGKEERSVALAGQVGATGALGGDVMYVGLMTDAVQAIDWKKGQVLWTFRPAKRQQPFASAVALTKDLVIAGSRDKRVYGIDRKTGEEVWSFQTEGRIESSPVVVGSRVYAPSTDGNLYVLDRAKGTLIQKLELEDEIVGSPAVSGGRLVIATVKGVVFCFGE